MLCLGVASALVAREIQGIGQKVEASHLSANMWLQGMGLSMSLLNGGRSFQSYDREAPTNPLTNLYKCKDGKCIQLMHLQPDRYWESMVTILGAPELLDDPRFSDMESRAENSREIVKVFDARFATRTQAEWDQTFRSSGIDFIYAIVQRVEDLEHDPQVIANDFITSFDHPVIGPVKMTNHPNIYSETPAGIWKEAPELGQNTEEILIEELGYTWEDIGRLQQAGAIL